MTGQEIPIRFSDPSVFYHSHIQINVLVNHSFPTAKMSACYLRKKWDRVGNTQIENNILLCENIWANIFEQLL